MSGEQLVLGTRTHYIPVTKHPHSRLGVVQLLEEWLTKTTLHVTAMADLATSGHPYRRDTIEFIVNSGWIGTAVLATRSANDALGGPDWTVLKGPVHPTMDEMCVT